MTLAEQLAELLEDYRLVGIEAWKQHDEDARRLIREATARGQVRDFRALEEMREQVARDLAVQEIAGFLDREGIPDLDADRVLTASFTPEELARMQDGAFPARERIDAYRVRAFLVHFASLGAAFPAGNGVPGEGDSVSA